MGSACFCREPRLVCWVQERTNRKSNNSTRSGSLFLFLPSLAAGHLPLFCTRGWGAWMPCQDLCSDKVASVSPVLGVGGFVATPTFHLTPESKAIKLCPGTLPDPKLPSGKSEARTLLNNCNNPQMQLCPFMLSLVGLHQLRCPESHDISNQSKVV